MNIGFDGKRAANNLTGLGNYSRSLITHLSSFFHQNHYFVYSPKVKAIPQVSSFLKRENIHLCLPDKHSLLWRSLGIKKQFSKDRIDLYHGLSNEIPLGMQHSPVKTVVTIHDLIFLRLPQQYKFIDRSIYNFKSKYACKHADRIIAISEQTKKDIIHFYHTDPAKIEVIYQTCDDAFKQLVPEEKKESVRSRYNLPEKYLLNVGTIEPRKNLKLIVQALREVPQDVKLVVVGKKQPYAAQVMDEIIKLGLEKRVIFLRDIPFSDLPAIYQSAQIFIYPSFYEGFGIPVIEALYSGIPVIAATGSCLEEAGGSGSVYIDPNNAAELTLAINTILQNSDQQSLMREKGLVHVQQFEAEVLANQLMNCYLNINLHHAKNGN